MNKKTISRVVISTLCVASLTFSAGAFISARAAQSQSPSAAPVAGQPVDLTYASEKALPCVVHIRYLQNSKVQEVAVEQDPFSDFFDPFGMFGQRNQGQSRKRKVQTPKKEGSGSGVIISSDGYIVTNNHVVEGADELTITLDDNREFSARIIGTDPATDQKPKTKNQKSSYFTLLSIAWSLGKGIPLHAFTCVHGSASHVQKGWSAGRPRGNSTSEVIYSDPLFVYQSATSGCLPQKPMVRYPFSL